MNQLRPWRPKKIKKLGGAATLYDEVSHFVHGMGNMIAVLMLRMETREMHRSARQEEREEIRRNAEALRKKHRKALAKMRKDMDRVKSRPAETQGWPEWLR